jgi:hypothetical protein
MRNLPSGKTAVRLFHARPRCMPRLLLLRHQDRDIGQGQHEGWTNQRLALFFVFNAKKGAKSGAVAVGGQCSIPNSPSVNPSVTSGVSLRARLWRWSSCPASRFFLFHPQSFPPHCHLAAPRASLPAHACNGGGGLINPTHQVYDRTRK